MRLGYILFQQHSGFYFKKHWTVQGRRILRDTGALKSLVTNGIDFVDAEKFALPQKEIRKVKKPTFIPQYDDLDPLPIAPGEECLLIGDGDVLLEGLTQAKTLTNTVELHSNSLPDDIFAKPLLIPENCDQLVQSCLKRSIIYETEQKKLPVRKDPNRPAWKFARDYGVTDRRQNELVCLRLLELCGRLGWPKQIMENAQFTAMLDDRNCGGPPVTFAHRADLIVLGDSSLPPPAPLDSPAPDLPLLSPLLPTVSIRLASRQKESYPLTVSTVHKHVNLAVFHYNGTEVKTEYELPVTEEQFTGRTLTKAFTVALCQSRFLHGRTSGDLTEPVTLRAIHTDGRLFHFTVLQLNTTKSDGQLRNFLWQKAPEPLFERCTIEDGRPVLEGYNPRVFRTLLAFYNCS